MDIFTAQRMGTPRLKNGQLSLESHELLLKVDTFFKHINCNRCVHGTVFCDDYCINP